ncbi:hypothetical protein CASFOL_039321 [Castilleja foliolosa]|uniref:Peptidase S26 domain-containing protein n=1 Tax=Castilleja foliolosa TaxID=1961234 RepID=A0ABD3BI49_9LAMI
MGIQRLQELSPYVKEALQKTAGLAKLLCFLHVTSNYLCCLVKPVGPSMLPTFRDGDIVLAEKVSSRRGKVGSGDAVLVRSPEDPTKVVTKRVKGVEGDVVSYALDPQNSNGLKNVTVPKGHVWIEGDNLENSRDSRHFGPVPYALIHSRVFFCVWPLKDFGSIGNKVL